ncbi:ATP-binding protein [Flindersiella endophytica]
MPDAGAGDRPAPERATTVAGYVHELRLLKAWAGNPSLDRLSKLTGQPRSTLFDALNAKRSGLPALDLVRRYVRACGWPDETASEWVAAWRRIAGQAARVAPTGDDVAEDRSGTTAVAGAERTAALVPRQLPAVARHFVGRSDVLKALDEFAYTTGAGVPIAAITGPGGVGKTTLAVHWAHQVAGRFPDGQLYVDLRGFDPAGAPMSPESAIRGFLDALGVAAESVPVGLDAQAAMYRSLLAGRALVVVLDNAIDSDQVRPLLPGSPECMVLVTSRDRLLGMAATQAARLFPLDPLSDGEAHDLLDRHLGSQRTAAEPMAAAELVESCDRLPLALAVAAARAAGAPDRPLAALAAEFSDARQRLAALETGDPASSLRTVLDCSYRALSSPARELFRLLGAQAGPEIGDRAVASLAALPLSAVRTVLAELNRASLVSELAAGRFTMHDLLRVYATDLAGEHDSAAERRSATHRLLDHYLHTALPATRLLVPIRERLDPARPQPGVRPEQLADRTAAMAWFTTEHHALVAAVAHAAGAGFDTHAWQLARALVSFLDQRGHWTDWLNTQEVALAAAERQADVVAQAMSRCLLASAHSRLGDTGHALVELTEALALFTAAGSTLEVAGTHLNLSSTYDRIGDHHAALDHARRALELYRETGDRPGLAGALNNAGWHRIQLGEPRAAIADCEQALELFRELNRPQGMAITLDSLALAYEKLGEHQAAIDSYVSSLELFREIGNRLQEAEVLTRLGDAQLAAGQVGAARVAWRRALSVLEDLGHEGAGPVRDRLLRSQPSG